MSRYKKSQSRQCPWCHKGVKVVLDRAGREVWLDGVPVELEPGSAFTRAGGAPIYGVNERGQEVRIYPYHECAATGRVLSREHVKRRWRLATAHLPEDQRAQLIRWAVSKSGQDSPFDIPTHILAYLTRQLEVPEEVA